MRAVVPQRMRRRLLHDGQVAAGGPSEVEKTIALNKALQEETDREVDYYTNPTILSRLVQNQKFTAALQRLENKGPAEAGIWVASKRKTRVAANSGKKKKNNKSQDPPQQQSTPDNDMESHDSFSTLTQSFVCQVEYQEEYSFRALPIHLACSMLGKVVDKGLAQDLEKLIAYLAIVYPEGCSRRDHDGRMPLHQAIWYNASPNTVSALLMAAPQAVQEKDIHGRYPIALNEHRTGEHKAAVRKLLKLRRKYWDMAREEATLRFKHRHVPAADESINSTSVLASNNTEEETLLSTESAFQGRASPDRKSKIEPTTGRQAIKGMSWSQLEKRAMLAEQKLDEVNEINYILSKQVFEIRAAKKDLESKLKSFTKTDLGKQVERLELEKEDLAWQVQRLYGLLLRNGIAIDPDEASCFMLSATQRPAQPPLEVQASADATPTNDDSNDNEPKSSHNSDEDNADDKVSDEKRLRQQEAQIEVLQQQVEALAAENQQYQEQLEINEDARSLIVPRQQAKKMPWNDDESTVYPDDLSSIGVARSVSSSLGSSPCSHHSLSFRDLQILEEMNERVRQLVIAADNDDSNDPPCVDKQGKKHLYPKMDPPSTAQESVDPTADTPAMDQKPHGKPDMISKKQKLAMCRKEQPTTVAAYDVTYKANTIQPMSVCTTIQEDEEAVPEQQARTEEGTGEVLYKQPDSSFENVTVTCNRQEDEDDLDSLLAEAIRLNGGRGFSPQLMRMWMSTTSSLTDPSMGLSALSLPSIAEQQLHHHNEQRLQQVPEQQEENRSHGSSSTDSRANIKQSSSPPPSSPRPGSPSTAAATETSMSEDNNLGMSTVCYPNNLRILGVAKNHPSSDGEGSGSEKKASSLHSTTTTTAPCLDDMSLPLSDTDDNISLLCSKAAQIYAAQGEDSSNSSSSNNSSNVAAHAACRDDSTPPTTTTRAAATNQGVSAGGECNF